MSLQDGIAAELPYLQAQAESLMVDTVLIERQSGTTIDPDTLAEVPAWSTVYEGKGRIQRAGSQPTDSVSGGAEFGVGDFTTQLPVSITEPRRGDRVTVAARNIVGTVNGTRDKTHETKRTLVCEEVS